MSFGTPGGPGAPPAPGFGDPGLGRVNPENLTPNQQLVLDAQAQVRDTWARVRNLQTQNELFWEGPDRERFEAQVTRPFAERLGRLQGILEYRDPDDINFDELSQALSELNRELDDHANFESLAQVYDLVGAYIREQKLLPKNRIEDKTGAEIVAAAERESLNQEGLNLDEAFRIAVTEHVVHRLTSRERAAVVEQISDHSLKDTPAMQWIISFMKANGWVAGAHTATTLILMAIGIKPEEAVPTYRAAQAIVGATVGGIASFAYGQDEIHRGRQTAEQIIEDQRIPSTAGLQALLSEYQQRFEAGHFRSRPKEALALLEDIAEQRADLELEAAVENTGWQGMTETRAQYLARILTLYKTLQSRGSELSHTREVMNLTQQRLGQRLGLRSLSSVDWSRLFESVSWGAVGGIFSYQYPFFPHPRFPWSPTAPSNILTKTIGCLARVRATRTESQQEKRNEAIKRSPGRWEWLGHNTARRQKERLEALREGAMTPEQRERLGLLEARPFKLFHGVDELMFYRDWPLPPGTDPLQLERLDDDQLRALGLDRETVRRIVDANYLPEGEVESAHHTLEEWEHVLKGFQGYGFFTRQADGTVRAYRFWPRNMRSGNSFSEPDPSNWPNLQEEGPLQHTDGWAAGEFMAREYALNSLYLQDEHRQYEPIPEMGDEYFKLTWNMPSTAPGLWRSISESETGDIHSYQTVLPYTHDNKRTQAFIRPDLLDRFAYEIDRGLDPESLFHAISEAVENGRATERHIDEIIARARRH